MVLILKETKRVRSKHISENTATPLQAFQEVSQVCGGSSPIPVNGTTWKPRTSVQDLKSSVGVRVRTQRKLSQSLASFRKNISRFPSSAKHTFHRPEAESDCFINSSGDIHPCLFIIPAFLEWRCRVEETIPACTGLHSLGLNLEGGELLILNY